MNSASRDLRGLRAEDRRRSKEAEQVLESPSSALATADDEALADELRAELDRRLALLNERDPTERRFAVDSRGRDGLGETPIAESLADAMAAGGPMPADVAEECLRGLLAALRSAHQARWNHGDLSLDAFMLDAEGRLSLVGAGRSQRTQWLRGAESVDRTAFALDVTGELDRRWNDAFVDGAAHDVRRLSTRVVPTLAQAIEGAVPSWVERLQARLEGVDGTIAAVSDLDHAWRTIDAAFDAPHSAAIAPEVAIPVDASDHAPSDVACDPIVASCVPSIDETSQDLSREASQSTSTMRRAASGAALAWVCVAGGLAALAGAVAAAIVRT